MSSQIVDVAEAVKTSLNAGTFSQTFTAMRKWVPKVALAALDTIAVTVVPKDYARENETRGETRRTIQIDIGIQKRFNYLETNPEDPTKLDELDELMQLVEEIANYFTPGGYGGARWVRTEIPEPMFDIQVLDKESTFTSVVTVTLTRV